MLGAACVITESRLNKETAATGALQQLPWKPGSRHGIMAHQSLSKKELHYQQKGKKGEKEKERKEERKKKKKKKNLQDLFGVQSAVRLTSKPSSSLANVAAS